jgi:hypothetical protein
MEFVVLIAGFALLMLLVYYIKKLCYTYLTAYKRKKYSLIIVSILYTAMIIYFILSTVKYFDYGHLMTYVMPAVTVLFAAFSFYYIQSEIKKLKRLKPVK